MEKRINVPDTTFHNYLKIAFGEEDVKEALIRLGIAESKHKATRLVNGVDDWSGEQLGILGQALDIDWYWDFVREFDVPTSVTVTEANSMRKALGEVFQPVAIAS